MRRLLVSILVAVTVMAIVPMRAYADEQWCETDPVFIVGDVPIRVTAGLRIDPVRVIAVRYELHVAQGSSVSVVATQSSQVPEAVDVYADLSADSTTVWLVVTVETTASSDNVSVEITTYGPTAQQPDVYAGSTNVPVVVSIALN